MDEWRKGRWREVFSGVEGSGWERRAVDGRVEGEVKDVLFL